jgi:hypothetical protein
VLYFIFYTVLIIRLEQRCRIFSVLFRVPLLLDSRRLANSFDFESIFHSHRRAVFRIRMDFMRIRIQLFKPMRIRIQVAR